MIDKIFALCGYDMRGKSKRYSCYLYINLNMRRKIVDIIERA